VGAEVGDGVEDDVDVSIRRMLGVECRLERVLVIEWMILVSTSW
jgi:hypothetical protein